MLCLKWIIIYKQTKQHWRKQTEMFPPLQSPLNTQWESCWHLCDYHGSLGLRWWEVWVRGGRTEVTPAAQCMTDGGANTGQTKRARRKWKDNVMQFHKVTQPERAKMIQSKWSSIVFKVYIQGFIVYVDIKCLWHLTVIDLFSVQQCKETRQSCNFRQTVEPMGLISLLFFILQDRGSNRLLVLTPGLVF